MRHGGGGSVERSEKAPADHLMSSTTRWRRRRSALSEHPRPQIGGPRLNGPDFGHPVRILTRIKHNGAHAFRRRRDDLAHRNVERCHYRGCLDLARPDTPVMARDRRAVGVAAFASATCSPYASQARSAVGVRKPDGETYTIP